MKVAVTGAAGFVGTRVVAELAARPEVSEIRALDRVSMGMAFPKTRELVGDFDDAAVRKATVDGANAVVHLAAILGGAAEANPELARRVNLDATLDLMEHLKRTAPSTRMVFASTIAVYAKPMPEPVTDDTPFGPTMIYGAQKLMIEVALSNYSARGWLQGVSLRPAGIMARDGAGAALKSAFMSQLFWAVARGEDMVLPVAAQSRTWLASVTNVARNFVHATLIPEIGPVTAMTLPALSLTFGELVAALHRRFPKSPSRIAFAPEPETVGLFGSYPRLETAAADALGFTRDHDADALVARSFT